MDSILPISDTMILFFTLVSRFMWIATILHFLFSNVYIWNRFDQSLLAYNFATFFFFFFDLRGVSGGPAYAHHDYSPRPTGHPASPGAGKAPRG